MANTSTVQTRNPSARYDGGFDRWDRNARIGWSILWRASEHADFTLGADRTVWVWDAREHIWTALPANEQDLIWREHELTLKQLRRALPVMRLYLDGAAGAEREAAKAALYRIGAAIVAIWQEGRAADQLLRGEGWIDHPAALYRALMRDCRHQFTPPIDRPFDSEVFAELLADTQNDFLARVRPCPPRLQRGDLACLQTRHSPLAQAEPEHADDLADTDPDLENAALTRAQHAERLVVERLRQSYQAEQDAAARDLEAKRGLRYCYGIESGLLAAGLALLAMFIGIVVSSAW